MTNENAPAVAQICHRLDGIPLAMELAAARIRVLTPEQIAARLDDRLRLLTGGSRTALPRQQTLRALVDWSYDLLSEQERTLLRRLSVFAGGWTLEAAEAVCAGDGIEDWEILDLLTQLVDKSVVIAETHGHETRYRLLETLRQYGAEKLATSGEVELLQRAHALWYMGVAEREGFRWWGPDQAAKAARLSADQDNLRAALAWSLEYESDERIEAGLRIAASLDGYWFTRGLTAESHQWYEQTLGLDPGAGRSPDAGVGLPIPGGQPRYPQGAHPRVAALCALSLVAFVRGDLEAALAHAEDAERLAILAGDEDGLGHALAEQGFTVRQRGDFEDAAALFEASLRHFEALGRSWGTWRARSGLGETMFLLGNTQRARTLLEESLSIARANGDDSNTAKDLKLLGVVALTEGDLDRAESSFEEALAIWQRLESVRGLLWVFRDLGEVFLLRRQDARAMAKFRESLLLCQSTGDQVNIVRACEGIAAVGIMAGSRKSTAPIEHSVHLLGMAEAQRVVLRSPLRRTERPVVEPAEAAARAELGDAPFERALAEGRGLSLDQGAALALEVAHKLHAALPR